MLVNTEYFRLPAKHFTKYGRYDDGIPGTVDYHRYWKEEIRRCLYGHTVGDTTISGYYYNYLNYSRIMLVKKRRLVTELYGEVLKDKVTRIRGDRVESFPDIWDVDFEFFSEVEKAEEAGQHFVWLKPRGVGASFKVASMFNRNFQLIPKSMGFAFADLKAFLNDDGLLTKFNDMREFLLRPHKDYNELYTTPFAKPSDYRKSLEDMHWRASSNIDGIERGIKSEVFGVPFKGDIEKGRGKRGKLVAWEELGAFPLADQAWNITRQSVEQQDVVYGLMIGLGTGGTEGADFLSMERFFYNPEAYNIRCFDNIYDPNALGTKCAYFTPASRAIEFKDKDGNSDTGKGLNFITNLRKEAAKSTDPNALLRIQAELPLIPQEALLSTGRRIMPAAEAKEWRIRIQAEGIDKIGIPGRLEVHSKEGIRFQPDLNLIPIYEFPHNPKTNLAGCVVIYEQPYKINGVVPDRLYIAAHDPYAHDTSTTMESLGATYIYMNPNNLRGPGDKIVATYFGRPRTQDEYNRIMFLLARYYNAKIGFENDMGDVVGYAKRTKQLDMLQEEFELGWDEKIKTKSGNTRGYGMHIGGGKDNIRINQGDKYLAEWLTTPRGKLASGIYTLNLHTIYCPGTLREIELYPNGENFDRVSALRVLMYYRRELDYKNILPKAPKIVNSDSLFNKSLFQ